MRSASRWIYVAVGCVVLLFSGLVYAWSVLSGPIAAEFPRWTTAQLSLTFTIVMSFFCLGGLTCGALSARISPRIFLWISALLFLAGFLLTAGMRSLPMLYVGFGVVCGLASGFSYNAVLGTVGAWFPDKQGLVSGILLMGFGLSSFLIGKLSFTEQALDENFKAVADEIKRLKPSTVKGRYVTKATITSTMNPGVPVDPTVIA